MNTVRIDYQKSDDPLDVYLHNYRYKLASKWIKGRLILDVGCGYGFGTRRLAELNPDKKFVGIDFDKKAIDFAIKRNKLKNIKFYLMDATKLGFRKNYFDSVVSIENLEHVPDYKRYLEEINRVVKDEGILFLTTPNLYRLGNIHVAIMSRKPTNKFHVKEFGMKELKSLIEKRFKIIRFGGILVRLIPNSIFNKINRNRLLIPFLVKLNLKLLNDYFYLVGKKYRIAQLQ